MDRANKARIEIAILERLTNGESHDDIILDLCENENMRWPEAEALLERVGAEKMHHIILAQSPLLILIALAIFLGGVGLTVYSTYNITSVFLSYYDTKSGGIGALGMVLHLFTYGDYLWFLAFLGLGMIIGSLKGMEEVWAAIFHKLGIIQ
ncbi:MAG: hypothetical protein C4583_02605 [Anaerolineaceae bacterium]|nr:MAG: hypothetical protein C4583_02605 [Anaerolineaceae bacterium]